MNLLRRILDLNSFQMEKELIFSFTWPAIHTCRCPMETVKEHAAFQQSVQFIDCIWLSE